MGHMLAYTR